MVLVIACPRCRSARLVEEGRRTASCGSCGRVLKLDTLRAFHTTPDESEARLALGMVNARLTGRSEEYERALLPPAPRVRPPSDAWTMAAVAARKGRGRDGRLACVARELSLRLGSFVDEDLARAAADAGVPLPKEGAAHLVRTGVLYEPRPGRYAAL